MSLSLKDKEFNLKKLEENRKTSVDNAEEIIKYYTDAYKNNRTLTAKISVAKKYFEQNGYPKKLVLKLYPKREVSKKVRNENEKVLSRTRTIDVPKSFVDNIIANYPREKISYEKLAVYLLLASGRRLSEILESNYSADPNDRHSVIVDVLLKKRDATKNHSVRIIGSRDLFLKTMEKFRLLTSQKQKITVQQNIQRHLRENYSKIGLGKSHMLRVLYSNYLYQFNNPDKLLYNVYLKEVLNHNNLLTSINYSNIRVV